MATPSFNESLRRDFLTQHLKTGPAYAALYKSDPRPNGLGEEVAFSNGYVRIQVTFDEVVTDSAAGEVRVSNKTELKSPVATGTWGLVGWVGLLTAPTGGTFICGAPMQEKKQIETSDFITIPVGGILAIAR